MVKTIPPDLFQFLGTTTNGDIGPFTVYTSSRKKLVIFLKTWPKDPATYHQKLNRDRFRHAAARWRSLSTTDKDAWSRLARRANLTISGFNLFIHYMMGKGTEAVHTCERLTGINVTNATGPPLPYLKI